MSAIYPPLSALLAVALSSPHPRPQSVRARIQSVTTTAVGPCPRTIRSLVQSVPEDWQGPQAFRSQSEDSSGCELAVPVRKIVAPADDAIWEQGTPDHSVTNPFVGGWARESEV